MGMGEILNCESLKSVGQFNGCEAVWKDCVHGMWEGFFVKISQLWFIPFIIDFGFYPLDVGFLLSVLPLQARYRELLNDLGIEGSSSSVVTTTQVCWRWGAERSLCRKTLTPRGVFDSNVLSSHQAFDESPQLWRIFLDGEDGETNKRYITEDPVAKSWGFDVRGELRQRAKQDGEIFLCPHWELKAENQKVDSIDTTCRWPLWPLCLLSLVLPYEKSTSTFIASMLL